MGGQVGTGVARGVQVAVGGPTVGPEGVKEGREVGVDVGKGTGVTVGNGVGVGVGLITTIGGCSSDTSW